MAGMGIWRRQGRWASVLWLSAATVLMVGLLAALAGCGSSTTTTTVVPAESTTSLAPATTAPPTTAVQVSDVVLASTTSTQDSGLFDVLIPAFEKDNPQYKVKVIAVGSGEAIKLGETKDADVLLVHSPAAEVAFVKAGFGAERQDVMYNDFLIVGPASDPAKIKGTPLTADALKAIDAAKATFITRADKSGTATKEATLWKAAGVTPSGDWYQATGQGMGESLKVASEKKAYILTDRATYLNLKAGLDLVPLVEGDKALNNQYGVIVVTGAKNEAGGQAFFDWILSPAGQEVIKTYGVEKYGQPLFIPNAK
jgi:tungstate transport system substrate-binding protein